MKSFLLRTVVSAGFLFFLFYLMRGNIPEILNALKNVDLGLISAATLIFFSTVLILAKRLQLIFAAEDVPISLKETVNLSFIGYFFNNFLPTSVGGDIVKAMSAARITGHTTKSVTSILLDRIFGLFTFIMIPSVGFLFILKESQNSAVPLLIYSFLGIALFGFFLIFNRPFARRFGFVESFLNRFHLGEKVRRIYDGLHAFKRHKAVVAQAMVLSVAGQAIGIFSLFLLARALGAATPLVYFLLLVPVVHLLSMLPSLNGLGIREGAYVYFLSPYLGRHNAAALGVLWLALLLLSSLVGGLIYLVNHRYHVSFKRKSTQAAS